MLRIASVEMTPEPRWVWGKQERVPGRGEPPAVQGANNIIKTTNNLAGKTGLTDKETPCGARG